MTHFAVHAHILLNHHDTPTQETYTLLNCHACYRVGLVLLVRFLVIELIYLGLNPKFNMSIIFMTNYF
jgi:hypothetical protein